MSDMIVQYGEINHNKDNNSSNHYNTNKGAIYNVPKAADMKSILM
jgi:hypothetical protein